MAKCFKLISNELNIFISDPTKKNSFQKQNSYNLPTPEGKAYILGFVSHQKNKEIHPLVQKAIDSNLGVVYVCENLPDNPIYHPNVYYLQCPDKWFIHTLFVNPLKFSSVFASKDIMRMAKAFSSFTKYNIPLIKTDRDVDSLIKNVEKSKNNLLIEIRGGIGDHLMTIPTLKTLDHLGYKVNLLCAPHRTPCFNNLPYIRVMYTKRDQVNISSFSKVIYLNFGRELNDYRLDVNKQNRIYAIANFCDLSKGDLVIDKPEIILTKDEYSNVKRKYAKYPNKVFMGSESARVDAKLPNFMAQDAINTLSKEGFTVFSSSVRNRSFENCIDLNKKLSLRELFALISIMDCMLSVDTAFVHIASAFNIPTVALMSYFRPSWRYSTYNNCKAFTPNVSCHPCIARQFVPSSEWQCHNQSCYTHYDWDAIYNYLENLKSEFINIKTEETTEIDKDLKSIEEDKLPGKVYSVRKRNPKKKIAAFWMGGLGDAVMLGYLCRAIKRKWGDCIVDAFVRDPFQTQLFVFDYPEIKGQYSGYSWGKTVGLNKNNYDIIYEFRHYPYCWHKFDPSLDKKPFKKELYDNWQKASVWVTNNYRKEIFRYYAEETDLELKDSDLRIPILDTVNENSIRLKLEEYDLPNKYITFNAGCDQGVGVMKLWPNEYWEELLSNLNKLGIDVIQVGSETDYKFKNTKRKIKAKNSVDLMYILKNSRLHISNEGGLAHLSHAVGTKSVVMFGPTKPSLYGYKDNINFYTGTCPSCWWETNDWSKNCREGFPRCKNLDEIKPDKVLNSIKEELSNEL